MSTDGPAAGPAAGSGVGGQRGRARGDRPRLPGAAGAITPGGLELVGQGRPRRPEGWRDDLAPVAAAPQPGRSSPARCSACSRWPCSSPACTWPTTTTAATRQCSAGADCILVHLFNGDGAIIDIVHLSVVVPVALGVFLGAPLIARETEQATNVLVWTQTVTRRRWLLGKVATAMASPPWSSAAHLRAGDVVVGNAQPPERRPLRGRAVRHPEPDPGRRSRCSPTALGIAMGALFRRSLPAIAATVGGYVAVRLLVALYLRPSYLHATSTVAPPPPEQGSRRAPGRCRRASSIRPGTS